MEIKLEAMDQAVCYRGFEIIFSEKKDHYLESLTLDISLIDSQGEE